MLLRHVSGFVPHSMVPRSGVSNLSECKGRGKASADSYIRC